MEGCGDELFQQAIEDGVLAIERIERTRTTFVGTSEMTGNLERSDRERLRVGKRAMPRFSKVHILSSDDIGQVIRELVSEIRDSRSGFDLMVRALCETSDQN
jgi:hypothetical protein